jgi:hypothetical protein
MTEQYERKLSEMELPALLKEKQSIISRMTTVDDELREKSDEYIQQTRPLKRRKTVLQRAIQMVKSEIKSRSGDVVDDDDPLVEEDFEDLL